MNISIAQVSDFWIIDMDRKHKWKKKVLFLKTVSKTELRRVQNLSPCDLTTFFGLLPGEAPAFPGHQRTPIIMTIKKKRTECT